YYIPYAALPLHARQRRILRRDELHCRLLEHAVRVAARIAIDRAGRRILRLALDAGEPERGAVRDAVVARRVLEPYGVVGRDRVEIGGGDVAPLGELALVPP